MTLLGQKEIFAIEWHVTGRHKNWALVNDFSYWANNQQIAIGGTPLHMAVNRSKDYLNSDGNYRQISIDFSSISKEDVFSCFFQPYHIGEFPEKYRDFYIQCKELMVEAYNTQKLYYSEEEMNESILRGNSFIDDFILGGWINSTFDITDLGGDAFLNIKLYIVRDITKNQDRFVWKYSDHCDKEGNAIQTFPVCEAIQPMGYFDDVITQFVEVASNEIEQILLEVRNE